MKAWLVCGLLAAGLGVCWHGAAEPAKESTKEPVWLTDYEQAKQVARASGKPIFAVLR